MMIHFAFYSVSDMAAWCLNEIPYCDYGKRKKKVRGG